MPSSDKIKIDPSWTLFLDRDGVINRRPVDDYVRDWQGFEFLPGVKEALAILADRFGHIFIVTNQQGIGKNLMTPEDLAGIHREMLNEITAAGGRIDAIYFCPDLDTKPNNCRKPGTAMALRAKKHFPDIDFSKSIMVGDTASDMHFGRKAGMTTVFVGDPTALKNSTLAEHTFTDLPDFARALTANV